MILTKVQHIYYRGHLRSCNYRCSYCPFAKHPFSATELEKDKVQLHHFTEWMKQQIGVSSIMFVPYGEALIHDYYIKALADLSKQENIKRISCQTNLSFAADKFVEQLKSEDAILSKINLWATYHDEMIEEDLFANKVYDLSQHINICVGVVGTPSMIPKLLEFRAKLPPFVYLWVNAMDGLKRKYTNEELQSIQSIDPLFSLEQVNPKADINNCNAAINSLFVETDGNVFACNRSKSKLGNIYTNEPLASRLCKTRACDCFLSYVHRTDMKQIKMFADGRFIRVPEKISINTLFVDIDGTLTDDKGCINDSTIEAIKYLSSNHKIYLATSLPFNYALRKCKLIWEFISGGVFANGADVRIFDKQYKYIVSLKPIEIEKPKGIKAFSYKDDVLYKLSFSGQNTAIEAFYTSLFERFGKMYHIVLEDKVISVTDQSATKLSGVLHLCKQLNLNNEEVMVVGNDENDLAMLKYFQHSVAVSNSKDIVKDSAAYVMNIDNLPIFIE